MVGVVTAEKELWRSDNTVPERGEKTVLPKRIRQMSALHIGFSAKKIMITNNLPIVDLQAMWACRA